MGVPIYPTTGVGGEPILVEFTSTEERWISYQIGLQLLRDSDYGALNDSAGTSIGTFTNTFFNEPVGTHPSTSITVGSTTKTIYQNLGAASEDSADWHRPLEVYDSGGFAGIREMDDTSLNAAVDRYLSYLFTNDLPGTYLLADSDGPAAPGYTAAVNPVFTDTRTGGYSKNYALWRRTSYTPPPEVKPAKVKYAGDVIGAAFNGVQEMTNAEIKTTFGQRAKTRINASGIGKYQLRSSAQGAPTDPGTWVAKGTAIDTRKQTGDTNFTTNYTTAFVGDFVGTFSTFFEIAYSGNYIGNFIGDYVSNYLTDYLTDYATVYEGAAFNTNFTRNSTSDFTGNFIGNFIGNYVTNFTRNSTTNFTGDFVGNFVGNYEGAFTRDSTSNFTRDSTNIFSINYQRNFIFDYVSDPAVNFTRNSDVNYQRFYARDYEALYDGATYTRNFSSSYQGDFVGNFTGNYIRFVQYVGDYIRLLSYTRNFFGNYLRNFTRDSVVNFAGGGGSVPDGTAYTGGGNDTDFLSPIAGTPDAVVYQGNTFGAGGYTGDTLGTQAVYTGIIYGGPTKNFSPSGAVGGLGEADGISGYGASFEGPTLYTSTVTFIGPTAGYLRSGSYLNNYIGPSGTFSGGFMYFNHGALPGQLAYVGPLVTGAEINYTRNFIGNYGRNFTRDSIGTFSINATFAGNYQRALDFTRVRPANFTRISTNFRPIDFIGTYQVFYLTDYVTDYLRTFVGDYVRIFTGNFQGNYARDYQQDYTGNFIGDFTGNFIGNYSRNFTRDSTSNFTQIFTGDFVGNYERNFTRDSTNDFTQIFTGDFVGNYQGDYIGTYEQLYTSAYEMSYQNEFTRDSTTDSVVPYVSNYLGNFEGAYQRDYITDYTGDFAGETILNINETIETYTLYVRIA